MGAHENIRGGLIKKINLIEFTIANDYYIPVHLIY